MWEISQAEVQAVKELHVLHLCRLACSRRVRNVRAVFSIGPGTSLRSHSLLTCLPRREHEFGFQMSKCICFVPSSLQPHCLIVSSRGTSSMRACVSVFGRCDCGTDVAFCKKSKTRADVSSITGLRQQGAFPCPWELLISSSAAEKLGTQLKRPGRSSGRVPELSPCSFEDCWL